jgi:DeoR-like helix-turn-helix domain
MKTNKHQTLKLVQKQRAVHSRDIVAHFGYSPGTARSYLSYLGRQDLLERVGANYGLTQRGHDRLNYFEVSGCPDVRCPLCKGKTGYLTCPSCGYQTPKKKAKILQKVDYLFVVRHAGVYCPRCLKLIFNQAQARLLGIREET